MKTAVTLHDLLKGEIERAYRSALADDVEQGGDYLRLRLTNGVEAEFRFADREQYAISWRFGNACLRVDTAPLHYDVETFPNHLHDADGTIRIDTLTRSGLDPWDNTRAVIDALLADPLAGSRDDVS